MSCEKKNDENLVPSYLKIDELSLTTNYEQGTNSAKITDAWVYLDETLIGAFELPATVPILAEGKRNITIRPGIKINGISNTRAVYPFFSDIKREVNLVKTEIAQFPEKQITYNANVTFPWMENFNSGAFTLDTTSKSKAGIHLTTDQSLIFPESGNTGSAIIRLTSDSAIFEVKTNENYEFPSNGGSVFLEMNYKINHPLVIGVFYKTQNFRVQRPLLILNPSDEWNKVYVNLSVPKYDTPSATEFEIFFGAEKNENMDEAIFLLDNLKLVHYKF